MLRKNLVIYGLVTYQLYLKAIEKSLLMALKLLGYIPVTKHSIFSSIVHSYSNNDELYSASLYPKELYT